MAKSPIRIANCSGACKGNIAADAEAYRNGQNPGWIPSAWDSLEKAIDLLDEKRIKVVINGGGLNPRGMAEKLHELVKQKNLNLKVAYVEGDDLYPRIAEILKNRDSIQHLDGDNQSIQLRQGTDIDFKSAKIEDFVSANAYLGFRAIKRGLDEGADIIICGRVSDAAPVIALAAWWHNWPENAFDALAGALIAGHLIECSAYSTGANFSGFDLYETKDLVNFGLPIVEIDSGGEFVVTKHASLPGFVTADIIKCQLIYELQGNIYLNSDVKADITHILVKDESYDRVHVSGVKGYPPPPTTKLALFYKGGYQAEISVFATGLNIAKKFDVQEAQLRQRLQDWGYLDKFDVLDFQRVGTTDENPRRQLAATASMRLFAQSKDVTAVRKFSEAWFTSIMKHFPGMHWSDLRTLQPLQFLSYYPGTIRQIELKESITLNGDDQKTYFVPGPTVTEDLKPRETYDTVNPVDLSTFGPTVNAPLGRVALGRSGDKGSNVNAGFFVNGPEEWEWLRTFLSRAKLQELIGEDWQDWYHIERVEFPEVKVVHFVVYGILGRGISGSTILDSLGKSFAEYIRAVNVPIPTKFLQ